MKKAYLVKETTEEFTVRNGELKPIKRKVTLRKIPPDYDEVYIFMGEPCSVGDIFKVEHCGESKTAKIVKIVVPDKRHKNKFLAYVKFIQ